MKEDKRGQEEMIGFALIIIIVAVIILFLLFFTLSSPNKQNVESFEVDSFIQTSLEYTTQCQINDANLSVRDLVIACADGKICSDRNTSCEALNSVLGNITESSWKTGQGAPVKGYNLTIKNNQNNVLSISKGNITANYKGGLQSFSRSGNYIDFSLKMYY